MNRPQVVVVDRERPDPDAIARAVRVLREGGLVAMPTETVYGLAARAFDEAAIQKVFAAKGRPATHPLIVHVLDVDGARRVAAELPDLAARAAARFFPGPLTLVVPRASRVSPLVAGGGDTVAVRAPSHPVARALLEALGEPLVAPSANRYQSISPTLAEHVVASLGDRVDLVLDAGPCEHGIESTVVDVTTSPPRLLRPGALSIEALRETMPDLVVREGIVEAAGVHAAPGLSARHYAPRAHVEVVSGQAAALRRASELVTAGKRVGVVLRAPLTCDINAGAALGVQLLSATPEAFASELFAALHTADRMADVIVVEDVPSGEAWMAVRDRLRRARA